MTDRGGGRVPKAIGVPLMGLTPCRMLVFWQVVGNWKRQRASPMDRATVAAGSVLVAGGSLSAALGSTAGLRGSHRRLTVGASLGIALPLALRGDEAIGFLVAEQVGTEYVLGLGADEDDPLAAVVLGLVRLGPIAPDL